MRYSRELPATASPQEYEATATHIRHHLSSVVDASDDPSRFAAAVRVTRVDLSDGRIELTGEIDAEPCAPYLRDDFDPEDDVASNPLTVPSIEEKP